MLRLRSAALSMTTFWLDYFSTRDASLRCTALSMTAFWRNSLPLHSIKRILEVLDLKALAEQGQGQDVEADVAAPVQCFLQVRSGQAD